MNSTFLFGVFVIESIYKGFKIINMNKKMRFFELLRFIICGLASAIADYLICQLVIFLIGSNLNHIALTALSTFFGFIVGVVVNYFISTFWVYRNVDKNIKTKSPKFVTLFVIFSLISLFLSIGTMLLCNLVVVYGLGLDSIVELSIIDLFKNYGVAFITKGIFWAYAISFVLKTLVGLIWNYFTRKYILYKEPKEQYE